MSTRLPERRPAATPVRRELRGRLTRVGWEPESGLSESAWRDCGHAILQWRDGMNWALGDWANYGEREYGDSAQAARRAGFTEGHMHDLAWVAGTYEPAERSEGLSWSHYRKAAPLARQDRTRLLAQAEVEGWSVAQTEAEVRKVQSRRALEDSDVLEPEPADAEVVDAEPVDYARNDTEPEPAAAGRSTSPLATTSACDTGRREYMGTSASALAWVTDILASQADDVRVIVERCP